MLHFWKKRDTNMDDVRIDVRLRHDKPVDLIDMANSLISLNSVAVDRLGQDYGIKDTKIVLNGVKEGCDIYQLSFVFSHLIPVIENFNTFASLTEHIKKFTLVGTQTVNEIKDDDSLNAKSAELVKSIVKPIENNNSSSLSIELHTGDNANISIYNISSKDAKKIRENVDLVKKLKSEEKKEENENSYSKVLIKMHTTTNTQKMVKDKSYCDDVVAGKAIATIFLNKEDKQSILEDPYSNYFLVDMIVNRIDGSPKLYTVTKLHEVISIE